MNSILIKRNGITIGTISYKMLSEEDMMGEVHDIYVPNDPNLELDIRLNLDNNPNRLSVSGGYAPDDIGSYSEGVVKVLRNLMDEHNFDVDLTDFPVYEPPASRLA